MKKIVEMTYCDRCSTAIAPEELENYEGFDLCRPCATELRRRICVFVSELKIPEQLETETTIDPVKPPSAEAIPAPGPEPRLSANPSRWSTAAFCISSAPAAVLPRPSARRSP